MPPNTGQIGRCFSYFFVTDADPPGMASESEAVCRQYFDEMAKTNPRLEWQKPVVDVLTRPHASRFLSRPQAAAMNASLWCGGHVIIPSLKRSFTRAKCLRTLLTSWASRNVILHLADLGVSTADRAGQALLMALDFLHSPSGDPPAKTAPTKASGLGFQLTGMVAEMAGVRAPQDKAGAFGEKTDL